MAWQDRFGNTAMGTLSGAGTGAQLGSLILPGWGTAIGAGIGGLAGGLSGLFTNTDHLDLGRDLISGEDALSRNLMNSGVYADVARGGMDPAFQRLMASEAYNNLLEGGVDPAYDSLIAAQQSPAFQSMLRGEVDPRYNTELTRAVSRRFGNMRSQVGANLANRGLYRSTGGARAIADTYNSERDALASALAGNQLSRMQFSHGMLGNTAGAIAGNRMARMGLGANIANQAAANRLSRGALFGQLSNTMMGRQRLGLDIMAQRNSEMAASGMGTAQAFGNLLEHNLARQELATEQAKAINRPSLFPMPNIGGGGSALKPTAPAVRSNPMAGRSGGRLQQFMGGKGAFGTNIRRGSI